MLCNVYTSVDTFYDVNKDLVDNINRDVRNPVLVVERDNTADMHMDIPYVKVEIDRIYTIVVEAEVVVVVAVLLLSLSL